MANEIINAGDFWLRDYVNPADPSSGINPPKKVDGRTFARVIQGEVDKLYSFAFSDAKPIFAVRTIITTNVSISGGLENGDSAGGVTLATNDIVVLAGQSTPSQNGAYLVPASGTASRHDSFNTAEELALASFFATEGTHANEIWTVFNRTIASLGTDPILIQHSMTLGIMADGSLTIAKTAGLQAALDAKAPIASPAFTGTVTGITKSMVTGVEKYEVKGTNIASAATIDLGAATGEFVDITGTTTITSLGTAAIGIGRTVRFNSALTLTHNATSLILPGAANITTSGQDTAEFVSLGSGNWLCLWYKKHNGQPVAVTSTAFGGTGATTPHGGFDALVKQGSTVAAASTVDLGATTGLLVNFTGGGETITSFGTAPQGTFRIIRVASGTLTLKHDNAFLRLPGGADIAMASGDSVWMWSFGSGVWACINYQEFVGYASPAAIRDRASHTGTQSADTVVDGTANKAFTAGEKTKLAGIAAGAQVNVVTSVANKIGDVTLNKDDVGLDDVDNVSAAALRDRSTHTGTQSADTISNGSANKVFTTAEQTKLAGIAAGATVNSTDAALRARGSHTGTQSADTIVDGTANKVFTDGEKTKLAGVAAGAQVNTVTSVANKTGAVTLEKADVGLGNVDNVAAADLRDRSTHTGTQSADTVVDGTTNKAFTAGEKTKLAGVSAGATANSSDAALRARASHTGTQSADTIVDGTANKVFTSGEKTKLASVASGAQVNTVDSVAGKTGAVTVTKGDVGLGSVDNVASATLLARANHTGTQSADTVVDGTNNKVLTAAEKTKLGTVETGATANASDAALRARSSHTGTQSADTIVDGTANKVLTAAEKMKLASVATGATANSSDATLLSRANHTGTQSADTIVDGTANKVLTAAEKTKLGTVETGAQVNTVSQGDLAPFISMARERPGETPTMFSSTRTGPAASRPPIAVGSVAVSDRYGSVLQVPGSDIPVSPGYVDVAIRVDFPLTEAGKYLVTWKFERATDPVDPAGEGIALHIQNLNKNKASLSAPQFGPTDASNGSLVINGDVYESVVADGAQEASLVVSRSAAVDVDYVVPGTTRYITPFIRLYGSTGATNIAEIGVLDVSISRVISGDIGGIVGDVSDIQGILYDQPEGTLLGRALGGGAGNVSSLPSDQVRAIARVEKNQVNGTDIASAATINLDAATGDGVSITGTATISAVTLADGQQRLVLFSGSPRITVGASLIGNNAGADVFTAPGDYAMFRGYPGGVVRFAHVKASGMPASAVAVSAIASMEAIKAALDTTYTSLDHVIAFAARHPGQSTQTLMGGFRQDDGMLDVGGLVIGEMQDGLSRYRYEFFMANPDGGMWKGWDYRGRETCYPDEPSLAFIAENLPGTGGLSRFRYELAIAGEDGEVWKGWDYRGRETCYPDEASLAFIADNLPGVGGIAPADLPVIGKWKAAYGVIGTVWNTYWGDGNVGQMLVYKQMASDQSLTTLATLGPARIGTSTGQSLAVGGGAVVDDDPNLTTVSPYPELTYTMNNSTGTRGDRNNASTVGTVTQLKYAMEYRSSDTGETPATQFMAAYARYCAENGMRVPPHGYRSHATGGARLSHIVKGGTGPCYENGGLLIAKFDQLFDNYGYDGGQLSTVEFIHGEQDRSVETTLEVYRDGLAAMIQDYNTDYAAYMGPHGRIIFNALQLAAWTKAGASTEGLTASVIAMAQAELARDVTKNFQIAAPGYIFPRIDGVHLTAIGSKLAGEYLGRAAGYFDRYGANYPHLYVKSAALDSDTITLQLDGGVGALRVFSSYWLPLNATLGFRVGSSAGEATISSVKITGYREITIKLSAALGGTGQWVDWAYDQNGTPAADGYSRAYTNICDSETAMSHIVPGRPLPNFLTVDKIYLS